MSQQNFYGSHHPVLAGGGDHSMSNLPAASLLRARMAMMRGAVHPGHAMTTTTAATSLERTHQSHGNGERGAAAPTLPDHLMAVVRRRSFTTKQLSNSAGRAETTIGRRAADPPGEHAGISVTSGDISLKRGFQEEQPVMNGDGAPILAAQAKARLTAAPGVDFLATAVMAVEASNAVSKKLHCSGGDPSGPPLKRGRLTSLENDAAATSTAAGMSGRVGRSWDQCFEALMQFHALHGHCNVTADGCPEDLALVIWASDQRTRKLYLAPQQRYKLDMLGFRWDNNNSAALFSIQPTIPTGQAAISAPIMRAQASHLPARNIFDVLENYTRRLPTATQTTSQALQETKSHSVLTQKKQRKDRRRDADDEIFWNRMYQTLQGFHRARGHCRISPDVTLDDQKFSDWAIQQRDLFRRNLLSVDRYGKLNAIGFEWGATDIKLGNPVINTGKKNITKKNDKNDPGRKRIRSFEENFQALIMYKNEFGNCDVPQKNGKLGIWVKNVRQHPSRFSDEQQERLESIGFKWKKLQLDDQWSVAFKQLLEYRDRYGDCNVPSRWKKSPALARWVHTQRTMYRREKLLEDRKIKLETAGFVWDCNAMREDQAFHENYEKLVEYKRAFGHCNIPAKYRRDRPLGRWAAKMRVLRASDELDVDRLKALSDIQFGWEIDASSEAQDSVGGSQDSDDSESSSDDDYDQSSD